MVQTQNDSVDLEIQATSFMGLTSYGLMVVGDKALEFYDERNPQDYIQIPWVEIDHVAASVLFGGRVIPRFAVFTRANGTFSFSTRDNKRTLRAIREHVDANLLVRSPSFLQVIGRGLSALVRKVLRRG